jgi:predicted phage terminase large subunit-like protein
MELEALQLESLADDVELRRAAAKTLKGFCATYLAHHFPQSPSDFFDEMAEAPQDHDARRLEIIGFRGCAKSTMASLALVLWAALEHPDKYPFIIMLADTRGQASINAASVQHELRNNDLILKDYEHLKYKRINDSRPEPTLESDEVWQAMNCVLDNGVRMSCEFYVEAVAYQQAAIEEMERRAFSVQAMHPIKDKRARLRVAARYIKLGVVKFPRAGCKQLLTQLLGFGAEKHDDAVDALVYLMLGVIGDGIEEQKVHYV